MRAAVETRPDVRSATDLLDLFEQRNAGQPDAAAFTFLADGDEDHHSLTRAELSARARAVAAELSRRHPPGARVLLFFEPGLDFVTGFWGCLLAGMVAVPVYPPHDARAKDRLVAIVRDAAPACALSTASLIRRSFFARLVHPALRRLALHAVDAIDPRGSVRWQPPHLTAGTVALIQYTSGSIAAPKGVVLEHRNLLANVRMIAAAMSEVAPHAVERDSLVSWLPPFHDMGLIGGVLMPPLVGGHAVLMSPLAFLQRPVRWLRALSRYRATVSAAPNFAYELCVRRIRDDELAGLDLSHWTLSFNGAETVRAETLERFAARFARAGLRAHVVYPTYGLAEATLFVCGGRRAGAPRVLAVDRAQLAADRVIPVTPPPRDGPASTRLVGCGHPRGDLTVRIVDPATGREVEPDRVGEIWVSGASVGSGYFGDAAETARSFGASLEGCGGFLRTGDLGFLHDGELFVTGRLKDLVIVRGRNHYPQDLEATLQRAHAALRPGCAAAFTVDGEGDDRVIAVQEVDRRAAPLDPAGVARDARALLIEEHGIALSELVLIRHGTLPKTSSGKPQRRRCRELFLAGRLELWTP